jgi:hypothetical protein
MAERKSRGGRGVGFFGCRNNVKRPQKNKWQKAANRNIESIK